MVKSRIKMIFTQIKNYLIHKSVLISQNSQKYISVSTKIVSTMVFNIGNTVSLAANHINIDDFGGSCDTEDYTMAGESPVFKKKNLYF